MKNALGKPLIISIPVLILLLAASMIYPLNLKAVGVGVTPGELYYYVTGSEVITQHLYVFNTGGEIAFYQVYPEEQYASLVFIDPSQFTLNPGENRRVSVSVDPNNNPYGQERDLNLYVKASPEGESTVSSGIIVKTYIRYSYPLDPQSQIIGDALGYLRGVQGSDGNIGGFAISSWVVMAIAAAGEDPHSWNKGGGPSIVDYLRNNRGSLNEASATDVERFILAITAAGEDPRNFGGKDYLSILESMFDGSQIGSSSQVNDDFWGILALRSGGVDPESNIIANTVEYLMASQNPDGGWSWAVGSESDCDNTAAAIMALTAAGEPPDSLAIQEAVNYLSSKQDEDGGFPDPFGTSNSATDSWSILALVSAGEDLEGPKWSKGGESPLTHLVGLQNPDGSFNFTLESEGISKAWNTAYAIPALLGTPYPVLFPSTTQGSTTTTTSTIHSTSPTTTTSTTRSGGEATAEGGEVYVRIEDESGTIWRGSIEIPYQTVIDCYNSGNSYAIEGNSVLAVLDVASEKGGFEYTVNDQWYPAFYVDSIGGHKAEGLYGWMYRVNHALGDVSMGDYEVAGQDEILIYWGTDKVRPLKVTVDRVEVDLGEPFTVTVTYRDDSTGEWIPLPGAVLHVNDDYLTGSDGKVTITLSEERVYNIYAERWGETPEDQFIRSDVIQVGVGVPIPEYPSSIPLLIVVILISVHILSHRKRGENKDSGIIK